MINPEGQDTSWAGIYKLGAAAALGAVFTGLLEIAISFFPGGSTHLETVVDWFMLFQENWFLGLRNLGLLNIILNTLGLLVYCAIFAALRKQKYFPYAALALLLAFLGIGVFFATNRAFPMWDLSKQYMLAATGAEKAIVEAAGKSMITVGGSHTAGTFLGFFLAEVAGILISIVMLLSDVFNKATAYLGILGFSSLLIFEFSASFLTGLTDAAMLFAALGGLLTIGWYILIARRLFQLGRSAEAHG
jgi:hypothetical protein